MIRLRVKKRRTLPTVPGQLSSDVTVSMALTAPPTATPDDVSRVITSAVIALAEDFGHALLTGEDAA